MNRKRWQWWSAWVLPAVMLRALIPVGFMPVVGPGHGVSMAVCDGYAPLPWMSHDMSMPMSMPMTMPMDSMDMSGHRHPSDAEHSGRPLVHHHGGCLYGSSPALGALLDLDLPRVVPQPSEPAVPAPQAVRAGVFLRAHSARGPPA